MEENPLKFMTSVRTLTEESIVTLSKYIHVNPIDLVLLESSTSAFNSIVKSLPFDKNTTVMYTNFEYGMIVVNFIFIFIFTWVESNWAFKRHKRS